VYQIAIHVRGKMRKTSRPQYARIRRILEMIREGGRRGVLPNAVDFCRELEVSRPTVMRDLDFLRDDERAPIEYVPSEHGYRLTEETWKLPAVELSKKEVFAFSVARRILAPFRGTPLEMDLESVFRKIADSLEGTVSVDLESLTEEFTVIGEDYVRQDPRIWSSVAGLVDRRERLRVTYQKFDGHTGSYLLEPYHLYAYHGNWYVLARLPERNVLATFALSRIRETEPTGEDFEVPGSFDPREHFRQGFGIVRGEKPFRVRLLFSGNVATYIQERVWHPTQEIVQKRDGSVELRMETAGWKELVRWVLSWQPDCKVLSPKRLRERVEQKMRQGLEGQWG
jgi:proteasome accessory factor B